MTYHNKRYRTDAAFRQRERDRAKAYYEKACPIRRRRIYLSKEVYQMREAIADKLLSLKQMETRLTELKTELEQCKWLIYEQRKSRTQAVA